MISVDYWSPIQIAKVELLERDLKIRHGIFVVLAEAARDQSPRLVGRLKTLLAVNFSYEDREEWIREHLTTRRGTDAVRQHLDMRLRLHEFIAELEKMPVYAAWKAEQEREAATRDRSGYGID